MKPQEVLILVLLTVIAILVLTVSFISDGGNTTSDTQDVSDLQDINTVDNGMNTVAVHTVKKGETLGEISIKYYGTSRRWQHILEANENLEVPEDLRPDMVLVIPKLDD